MRSGEEIVLEQEQTSPTTDQIYASLHLPPSCFKEPLRYETTAISTLALQTLQLCDVMRGGTSWYLKRAIRRKIFLRLARGKLPLGGAPLEKLMDTLSQIPGREQIGNLFCYSDMWERESHL